MKKILVVDDNPDNLLSIKALIADLFKGFTTLTAGSGPEGIQMAKNEHPDVILLDILMPGMDGFEVCKNLKQDRELRDIPVVFVTAQRENKENKIRALEAGGDGFLSKPVDEEELVAQLRAMIKIKEGHDFKAAEKHRLEILVAEQTKELQHELNLNLELSKNLKESEERFRTLFEKAPLGYQSLDFNGNFIEVNQQWLDMLGYTRDEVIGKWFGDFLTPEFQDGFRKRFPVFKSQGFIHSEFEMMHKDGTRLFIAFEGKIGHTVSGEFLQTHCILQDITERKWTEVALLESEERFKALHNASFGGIAIHDKGIILECNLGLSEMTGYTVEELTSSFNGLLLISEKSRDKVMSNILSGYEKPYEAIGLRKNGEEYPLRLEARNVPYKGKMVRTVEFRDITEQKQAELRLKESEERFKLAMRASNDGLFDWNLETNGIYYSPGWKKMLGYEDHELPNDFSVWETTTEPQDVKRSWELQKKLISKQIDRFVMEFKMKHKQGHWVDILSRAEAIFNENGKAIRIVGTHTNISERKKAEEELRASEEKFRLIVTSMSEGIVWTDNDDKILYVNDRLCQIYGYSSEELINKTGYDILEHPDYKDVIIEKNELRKHGIADVYEVKGIKKSGESIWVRISGVAVKDNAGNSIGTIGLLSDITLEKQAEEKLRQSEEQFRIFMNTLPDMVFIKDENLRYIFADKQTAEFFEAEIGDVLGKTDQELADINKIAPCESSDILAIEQNNVVNVEEYLGDQIYDTTKFPVLLPNGKKGLGGILRNITRRKQAEDNLRTLAQVSAASTDFIVIIDADFRYRYANEVYLKARQLSHDDIIGHHMIDIVGVEKFEQLGRPQVEAAMRGESIESLESTDLGKNELHYLHVHITPYREADGTISGAVMSGRDITEIQLAEDELLKLSQAVEQSPASVIITDIQRNIIYVNPKFTQVTGYLPHEVMGQNPRILKSGKQTQEFYNELWETISAGKEWKGEFYNKKKNDELYWESALITPIKNEKGEIVNYLAVKEDITEKKKMDLARKIQLNIAQSFHTVKGTGELLETIRQELSQLFDTTNFFIAMYNPEKETLKQILFSDEKDHFEEWDIEKSISGQVVKSGKTVFLKGNEIDKFSIENKLEVWGTESVCWLGVPVIMHNKVGGVMVIQHYTNPDAYSNADAVLFEMVAHETGRYLEKQLMIEELISAKESAERSEEQIRQQNQEIFLNNERLESLLRVAQFQTNSVQELLDYALSQAVELTKSKLGYIYFYSEEKKQFTLNTWSREVMKECLVFSPQTTYNLESTGCWGEAVRQRKPIIMNDYQAENPIKKGIPEGHVKLEKFLTIPVIFDEKIVAVAGVANKLTDYNDSDIRQLTLLMDNVWRISERLVLIKDLQAAKDKAEESDRLKSAFLANMSHEIRTPMNGVLGFLELLKAQDLSDQTKSEYIDIVNKSGQRLLSTINDIIELSKIESGEILINKQEIDLKSFLSYYSGFFTPQASEKGLLLEPGLNTSEKVKIFTDKSKLDSILTNLIKNAIKFTESGSIKYGFTRDDNDDLKFYVQDTGPGIHPEKLNLIFERFRQGEVSLSRGYEGSGLGLSITKAYVEALGGKIWVVSEYGKGSCFYFTIPNMDKTRRTLIHVDKLPTVKNKLLPGEKLNLLIAEDDEVSYLYLKTILKSFDVNISRCSTGSDTVEFCRSNPEIHLILMDIKMPDMDGYTATKLIREFNTNVVIIAQTAFAFAEDKEKAIAAGCSDYLSKPISNTQLNALINKHFGMNKS